MAADELIYGVSLDWDKLGFSNLNASIDKSIKAFAVATAAIAAASTAIFALGKNYATTTDALLKTSQRINTTTQDIQKLTFAAEDNGATMADVTSSLESLAKAKEQMLRGSGDFQAWGELGVNPAEYENTSDLLRDIAESVKGMGSQQAIDLMSRVGISQNMLQTLQHGKDGLGALGKEAEALGMINTPAMLKSSQDFMSGWQRASSRVGGMLDQVSAKMLKDTINPAIEAFNKFASQNMVKISKVITSIVNAVVKAGEVVFAFIHTAYNQFEMLSSVLGGTDNALIVLGAAFIALRAKMIIAMLPAIVVVGALLLALNEVLSFLTGKESFIGDFFDWTGIGAENARQTILGIKNAIKDMASFMQGEKSTIGAFFDDIGIGAKNAKAGFYALLTPQRTQYELIQMSIKGYKAMFEMASRGIESLIKKWNELKQLVTETLTFEMPKFEMPSFKMPSLDDITGNIKASLGFGEQAKALMQTTNNNQISITVDGAKDPIAVGEEVRRVLNEEMNKSAQRGGY
jgi:hypothetical protein